MNQIYKNNNNNNEFNMKTTLQFVIKMYINVVNVVCIYKCIYAFPANWIGWEGFT